jgi:hypothetical protein
VIDSFDDLLTRYPSLKAFVGIDDLDLSKIMKFGSEDEKMVIKEAIQSGDRIGSKYLETLFAIPNVTQMIAFKTHVFLAGQTQTEFISGKVRGVVDPTVHVARQNIYPRPRGVLYRNDLDEYLINILNQM